MILNDTQIKALGSQIVQPFDESMVNPSSLDIRIGNNLKLMTITRPDIYHDILNYYSGNSDRSTLAKSLNKLVIWKDYDISQNTKENPFWLLPEDRILTESLETFFMPNNVCGQFKLKSSRGREFYNHIFAGWIDPDWHNSKLTMEIENRSLKALPIYPSLPIGQIIFFSCEPPEKSYKLTGRYNNDSTVQQSKG